MLSPIPSRILQSVATLRVPTGFDRYQNPTVTEYTVRRVHLQADNHTVRTSTNTEIRLTGTLFVDCRKSSPALDWEALQEQAQAAGGQMTVVVADRHGRISRPFTVVTVDGLPDDEDRLHHWEIGVV